MTTTLWTPLTILSDSKSRCLSPRGKEAVQGRTPKRKQSKRKNKRLKTKQAVISRQQLPNKPLHHNRLPRLPFSWRPSPKDSRGQTWPGLSSRSSKYRRRATNNSRCKSAATEMHRQTNWNQGIYVGISCQSTLSLSWHHSRSPTYICSNSRSESISQLLLWGCPHALAFVAVKDRDLRSERVCRQKDWIIRKFEELSHGVPINNLNLKL